ncbi:MAG TPA: hypothetical protein VJ386_09765 [Candidatus Deferrimicrobiaceae bacterium]|jgi:hypothetical protein|nr:hypothetical protein [Candidatus Deferrimicrobiaceae bacterium]
MTREASKEEALKKICNHAGQIQLRSGNCAQTSFLVLKEQFNLDDGMIVKTLTPFPGIALRSETCGAILKAKLGKRTNLANPVESALYFASGGPE